MKRILIIFTFFVCCLLCSCSLDKKEYEIIDYMTDISYHDNFRIAQLTDLHFSDYDDVDEDLSFINLMYENETLDLVIITGDVFTFASKNTIKRVFDFFESKGIPWTITFGNHDEQIYADYTYLCTLLSSYENCLFKYHENDILTGLSNSIINLKDNYEDSIVHQLYLLDSNSYTYEVNTIYDFIHEDQIKWYEKCIDYTKAKEGRIIPSCLFQHIPLPEINNALESFIQTEGSYHNEDPCPPLVNTGFFEVIKNKQSTKSLFFGHDHINNFSQSYEGINFVYGLKSTDNMYRLNEMLGYRIITINNNGNEVDTYCVFHSYEEIK